MSSWTLTHAVPATDGSGLFVKKVIVETFEDRVAFAIHIENPDKRSSLSMLHLGPEEAEAIAGALRATAAELRKLGPT